MLTYEKNLISIIMPAFNSDKYIGDAIESVLQQTYQNFELIVVNDGSVDRTEDILKNYANSIHHIHQSNQGVASARNKGILAARGEYISFLDSDDVWFMNTLKLQYEHLAGNSDIGLVYGEMQLFDHTGTLDKKWSTNLERKRPEGYIFQDLVLSCLFGLSTVMVRRNVLNDVGLFDKNLPSGEDYDLWLRIAAKYKIGYIPEKLMRYRQHSGSLTSLKAPLKPWDIKVAEKALKIYQEEAKKIPHLLLKKSFAERYFHYGYSAFLEGQYAVARYRFIKSISFLPGSWRSLLYLIASCFFPRFNHSMIMIIKHIFSAKTVE